MGDGSNLGITADRALKTIIGGEDQPTEDEQATPEQVKERIMAAPFPLEGKPIFEREGVENYGLATDCVAKAFLLAEEEKPGILTKVIYYPDDCEIESLRGKPTDPMDAVWDYVAHEKWEGFDDWIGGASGFMVGFAYNTVLYIKGIQPVGNPAIMTIGE